MIRIAAVVALGFCLTGLPVGNRTRAQQSFQPVLDENMHILNFEALKYPLLARNAHIQGIVVVRATLDDHGNVLSVMAISGSKVLIPDALENARKWRFQPNAQKAAVIVYDFTIPGVCDSSEWGAFMFRSPNIAMVYGCAVPMQTSSQSRHVTN